MHYDEQRENDRAHNSVSKTQTTLSYALSENQHLTISWQLDELVLAKKLLKPLVPICSKNRRE